MRGAGVPSDRPGASSAGSRHLPALPGRFGRPRGLRVLLSGSVVGPVWSMTFPRTPEGFDSEQAHLSAQQPSAREDPRLPAAYAHPCRPRDPLGAAPQGPRPTLGLTGRSRPIVLAAEQRLRQAAEFSTVIRSGGRAGRGGLVIHVYPARASGGARAGFVVPKAVGPAVTRNKVRRRLRHLLRSRLATLPAGTDVVVRVMPSAASASYESLGTDLDAALTAAQRRHSGRPDRRTGGDRRDTAG